MPRQLKDDSAVTLDRPFALFVEPGDVDDDGQLQWYAKIVGFELDNIVYGESPYEAIQEALELLRLMSGVCTPDYKEHNFIVETEINSIPAWECARCGYAAAKEEFNE